MSKKTLTIIIVSLALVAFLAVILIAVKKVPSKNKPLEPAAENGEIPNAENSADLSSSGKNTVEPEKVIVKETDPEVLEEESIKTFSKIFYERYGSFSSDNNYESFNSLKSLMTDRAVKEMEEQVKSQKSKVESQGFYGVTTKVLAVKILNKTDLAAKVNVSYQKQETIGEKTSISYKKAEMELVKEKGGWEIDEIK